MARRVRGHVAMFSLVAGGSAAVKRNVAAGGIDHIMVGTDYPYDLGDWEAAKKVEQLDISDADKLLLLEGNAKRLLRIK